MKFGLNSLHAILLATALTGCDSQQKSIELDLELDAIPEKGSEFQNLSIRFFIQLDDTEVFITEVGREGTEDKPVRFNKNQLLHKSYFADVTYESSTDEGQIRPGSFGIGTVPQASSSLNENCLTCVAATPYGEILTPVYRHIVDYDGVNIDFEGNTLNVSIPIWEERLNGVSSILDIQAEVTYQDANSKSFDSIAPGSQTAELIIDEHGSIVDTITYIIDADGDGIEDPAYTIVDGKQHAVDPNLGSDVNDLYNSTLPAGQFDNKQFDILSLTFHIDRD